MTTYEIITLLIALLAATISAFSLIRTNSIHNENISVQKTLEKLSIKQLEQIEKNELEKLKANIHIEIIGDKNGKKFIVSNIGKSKASDIYIYSNENSCTNPFDANEYKRKIPIRSLDTSSKIEMIAQIYDQDQGTVIIDARWKNIDGSQSTEQFLLNC
jgi:hypothetical protein